MAIRGGHPPQIALAGKPEKIRAGKKQKLAQPGSHRSVDDTCPYRDAGSDRSP